MNYHSTRDKDHKVGSMEAILRGIAPDGGLYVPETFPKLPPLDSLLGMSYDALALKILKVYFDDYEAHFLKEAVKKAYSKEKFPEEAPVKLSETQEGFFLELFHGPTLAFKDMALCLLPQLMKGAMENKALREDVVILTATSGDTGKAALEGFRDVPGMKVLVFYPEEGVSAIQKHQMITQEGENTYVLAVKGNFDDAQRGVKEIFQDDALKKRLKEKGYLLSSANSINIGRLIPQIIYYIYSYLKLLEEGNINEGEGVSFTVPTGNFGNILAAHYARNMGLPIARLLCASNENHVLTDFFETGHYRTNRALLLTSSPSMDILVSSNLERYLYEASGKRDDVILKLMEDLKTTGAFQFPVEFLKGMESGFAREEETAQAIRSLYEGEGYIMDPHTAVAYAVNKKLKKEDDLAKHIILSTASPYKFPGKILSSLGRKVPSDAFSGIKVLAELLKEDPPSSLSRTLTLPVRHRKTIKKEKMKEAVLQILLGGNHHD